mmetsp:Transcript_34729/g.48149  ORF Transcript_34729/g.48149 Transcript_34729/m.48149 type:complete len:259 (-) Transcript_34729:60-836(-)|eukprot:CAMPEP_0196593252 /NCGR_PEP_ID=MMETSP1081-20130531/75182_1 /TAXON_ID=36882 /ORGANISM="Pyramimonas amylifera, Strain CCMP720" /LENGTH=258 /DNA_ID=CAMNT_0041917183 /DNA_START=220 /DNA_END=996 /DNA_ORIENTATION=+
MEEIPKQLVDGLVSNSEEQMLMYYKSLDLCGLEAQDEMKVWMEELCQRLGVTGKIIVAADGVSANLRGSKETLQAHVSALQSHPLLRAGNPLSVHHSSAKAHPSAQAPQAASLEPLSVLQCKELFTIVSRVGERGTADLTLTGQHFHPDDLQKLLQASPPQKVPTPLLSGRHANPNKTPEPQPSPPQQSSDISAGSHNSSHRTAPLPSFNSTTSPACAAPISAQHYRVPLESTPPPLPFSAQISKQIPSSLFEGRHQM